jgi:hypothetical protein
MWSCNWDIVLPEVRAEAEQFLWLVCIVCEVRVRAEETVGTSSIIERKDRILSSKKSIVNLTDYDISMIDCKFVSKITRNLSSVCCIMPYCSGRYSRIQHLGTSSRINAAEVRNFLLVSTTGSPNSSVGIGTRLRVERSRNLASFMVRGKRFFFSPMLPDRLWDPHSLPSSGYHGFFPRVKAIVAWNWWLACL